MSKILRLVIITLLAAVFVLSMTVFCCADTVPYTGDYTKCDIYVNGSRLSQPATLVSGNVYVDIDIIRQYGDTPGWVFDTDNEKIWMNVADQEIGRASCRERV